MNVIWKVEDKVGRVAGGAVVVRWGREGSENGQGVGRPLGAKTPLVSDTPTVLSHVRGTPITATIIGTSAH